MLLMLPLLLSTGAALAQFDDPAPGLDPASTSPLYRGEELLQTGSYAAAAEIFQQADGLDRNPGVIGASRALAAMGNLREAMRVCENLIDDDHADFPLVSTQLAEVKRMAGESAEALSILESVIDGLGVQGAPVRTLVQYAGLLQFVGRKPESYVLLEEVVDRYDNGLVFSSPDVAMVALASWMLDRFHDANSLFQEATRADPRNLEAHVLWGDLFLEKYNEGEAERSYADALEIIGRYTPALVGMAKITGDERALQRALAINPNSVPAMGDPWPHPATQRPLGGSRRGHFSRALNLNPEALGVLSALASEAAMEERMTDYALHAAQVEAFSPNNSIFLADVAEHFGGNYRFSEAVEYARASIEADPQYWRGYTLLGSNLIRLGEEAEGRANLEIGFENDPFNVLSSNLLTVFDTLEEYATLESEHFLVHMSPRDARILWPYMEAMLERSLGQARGEVGFRARVSGADRSVRKHPGFRRALGGTARHRATGGNLLRQGDNPDLPRHLERQLAGNRLARVFPRHHLADDRQSHSALAVRGHFGLGRAGRKALLGAQAGTRPRARGPEQSVSARVRVEWRLQWGAQQCRPRLCLFPSPTW